MINNNSSIWSSFISPKSILGILISLICLYFVYIDFDSDGVLNKIIKIDFIHFSLAILCLFLSLFVRAYRWNLIFDDESIRKYDLYRAEILGFWGNSVLPLKMGELIKFHYAKKLTSKNYTFVFGTILLERLVDFILITPFIFIFQIYFPLEIILNKVNFFIFLIPICILFYLIYKYLLPRLKENILRNISKNLIETTIRQKYLILSSTIMLWLLIFLNVHFIQASLQLGLTIFDSFSIMILGTIIYAVPSLPGGIATFHFAIQEFSVKFLNITDASSQAFAFILHAHSYIFFIILGSYYFIKDSRKILSFRR